MPKLLKTRRLLLRFRWLKLGGLAFTDRIALFEGALGERRGRARTRLDEQWGRFRKLEGEVPSGAGLDDFLSVLMLAS